MAGRDTRFDFLMPRDPDSLAKMAGALALDAVKQLADVEWEDFGAALTDKAREHRAFKALSLESQEAIIQIIQNSDLQALYSCRPDTE